MTSFEYEALTDPRGNIRLLDLRPGRRGDVLDISIREAQLYDIPSYEALSYTWGNESASHNVRLNGLPFAVRPNLFHCLNELRDLTVTRTLWVDAICIDQANMKERNQQVKEMGRIYSQANVVRISVGFPSSWTKEFFEYMNASQDQRASATWQTFQEPGILLGDGFRETPLSRALLDICSRAYWERAWILQEIMLSGHKVLHCGPYSTSWSIFCATLNSVPHSLAGTVLRESREKPVYRLSEIPDSQIPASAGWRKESTLEVLLENYGNAACLDLRDRVYALLSLAKDCTTDHSFPINYDENEFILFFRTLIFCQPKNPFKFASYLVSVLSIDKTHLQEYIRSRSREIEEKRLIMSISAYYFGTASEISISATVDNGISGWKHVRKRRVLRKLTPRGTIGEDTTPPEPSLSDINLYQIEGSPIGMALTSIVDSANIAIIPVVIQQVHIEESYKEELILHRASNALYNVAITSGNSLFGITVSLQPQEFMWLMRESERWIHIQQPWDKGRQRENVEESGTNQSQSDAREDDSD